MSGNRPVGGRCPDIGGGWIFAYKACSPAVGTQCARRGHPSAGPARGPAALPSAEIDQAHRRGPTGDCGGPSTGRLFERWPVLRPSRTFKRRQPAARPRILHTRRHDQAERARCRVMVRAACEGRLWPQQVHQTDLKACRRRAVVARARDSCRGAECSGEPEATWVTKWCSLPILSRAVL